MSVVDGQDARRRDLRRFIHDQHDTYFSRFADRDVLHDAFLTSVSNDVRAFAPRIAQPTLLVAAQQDDITPIEAERHLATLFPTAELVEIPDVGHLIHYETPARRGRRRSGGFSRLPAPIRVDVHAVAAVAGVAVALRAVARVVDVDASRSRRPSRPAPGRTRRSG